MLKLFCDKCGVELANTNYYTLTLRTSLHFCHPLIKTDKNQPSPHYEDSYELCIKCKEEFMGELEKATQNTGGNQNSIEKNERQK